MRNVPSRRLAAVVAVAASTSMASFAGAAGNPMTLVGALNPWKNGQFSNVAADAGRHVAYLGSYDDQGVAVIDTTTPSAPTLRTVLSTKNILEAPDTSDSADLDLVGCYLAVSHQPWSGPNAFTGVSVYNTCPNPYTPTLVGHWFVEGGVHTVQIDPEAASGRPYLYANSEENLKVTILNLLTGQKLGEYASPKGLGCLDADCTQFSFAHEGFIKRIGSRVLDYVSYWDSGLRIVDVTYPAAPIEVGSYDYAAGSGNCCAHYSAVTPSGNTIYLEDEVGVDGTGGVHVLDASACDFAVGSYCTPTQVGFWHINGHPRQAMAVRGEGSGAWRGVIQRFFTWDAHNLDVKGENTLLVANYTMGIRLVDTTDKSNPVETSFYLPNANKNLACNQACFFQGRETWSAYFGSDGNIYASDFWLGLFVVAPSSR